MRTGIYVRISDDKEGSGLGVARQEGDCREVLVEPNGWTVAEVYVDNDRSAYSGKPRPAYLRMLADAEAGRLDAIVAWHTDRLQRSPRELEEFIDLVERKGMVVQTVRAGLLDLATPAGRMVARQLGAVSRYESEHKADRQRAKHRQLALAGGTSGGGTRPFGFEADFVTIREDEAAVLREVTSRVLAGETLIGVASDLNARGITTSTGGRWQIGPMRRALMSARIAGKREYKGEIVADAVWPPIISMEQHVALRRLLTDPDRNKRRVVRAYLLKGLLRCSDCDAVLVARPRGDGARAYVCANGARDARFMGCGKRRVLAEPIEHYVTEAVFAVLDSPALKQALRSSDRPDDGVAQRRADNALLRLDELAATYAEGKITMREWLAAREPLEGALERARGELVTQAGVGPAGGFVGRSAVLRDAWATFDLPRRQLIVASMVDRVTVAPARRGLNQFDPSRFDIVWRF